jgi:hypothetical protein
LETQWSSGKYYFFPAIGPAESKSNVRRVESGAQRM